MAKASCQKAKDSTSWPWEALGTCEGGEEGASSKVGSSKEDRDASSKARLHENSAFFYIYVLIISEAFPRRSRWNLLAKSPVSWKVEPFLLRPHCSLHSCTLPCSTFSRGKFGASGYDFLAGWTYRIESRILHI